ncbi:MAG: hypothetical protein IT379_06020 [Deltaproteobacteria bacterium]|nr:hypothetical protein [Deltaproteobacteria bacterium]
MNARTSSLRRGVVSVVVPVVTLAAAVTFWWSSLHLWFRPPARDLGPPSEARGSERVQALLRTQLDAWADGSSLEADVHAMRATNPEWDFMGRTYLVLALTSLASSSPSPTERQGLLATADRVIDETLRMEAEHGQPYFLMQYVHASPFLDPRGRSIAIDGEIAMMLAARLVAGDRPELRPLLAERVDSIETQMRAGPVLSAESYPDECWTFCNTTALAAIRMADHVDGRDHSDLVGAWLATARARLVDPATGLLVSSYRYDGTPLDGPEGSTLWMTIHNLAVLDPAFAREQYQRAVPLLHRDVLGFGLAREWPVAVSGPRAPREGHPDVDSGPIIPGLDASAGSSGMLMLAAGTMDDRATLASLLASLDLAAFPVRDGPRLRYAASNRVGDAVLLYALVEGPLRARVLARAEVRS